MNQTTDNSGCVGCGLCFSAALVCAGLGWWLGGPGLILAGLLAFVVVLAAAWPKS